MMLTVKRKLHCPYLNHQGYAHDALGFVLRFRHVVVELFVEPVKLYLEISNARRTVRKW
jgi:hypothetical protein